MSYLTLPYLVSSYSLYLISWNLKFFLSNLLQLLTKRTTHTAGLGEHRVRELNDEINKSNKVKSYWDTRVVELGGGDQTKGRKFYDVEGDITPFFPFLFY